VLLEMPTEEEYVGGAREYDKTHPGYLDLIMWMRGRCFPTINAANTLFAAKTGRVVQL
jgi:hypothetical protein